MDIFINGTPVVVAESASVSAALSAINHISMQGGIAIAVNNQVVPRTEWENKQLQAGDQVTLIKATQGG